MPAEIHDWKHMTGAAIDALPRDRTVVLVTSSPLEVHGPHLPTITDICEAEGITARVADKLTERHPELVFVRLPPLYVAADVLPHVGSLKFRQSTIRRVFEDLGRSLCAQGFTNIWVGGFHGGPRHFTPIESAARVVNRRHGGRMVSVFSLLMTFLTGGRTDLSELFAEVDGVSAEDLVGDSHGGCIETSLMLHLLGEHVDPVWKEVGPSTVEAWLASNGQPSLEFDGKPSLPQLARMFRAKLRYYEERTWSGHPALASPELGAAFLDLLADQGAAALSEVWAGSRALADTHSPVYKARPVFEWDWLSAAVERLIGYRNQVW